MFFSRAPNVPKACSQKKLKVASCSTQISQVRVLEGPQTSDSKEFWQVLRGSMSKWKGSRQCLYLKWTLTDKAAFDPSLVGVLQFKDNYLNDTIKRKGI